MKKRLMSLLLATMMLLSILPVGVSALPVTGNTGVPTEPELRMHVRQWRDGVESEYVTTEFSYPLLDWWDAKFFMYYPDGSTKPVDPYAMSRTTEIDLIGVDDDGWAEHRSAHVGPGLIDYTENGVTYHIEVDVHYPDLGMYDSMPFDESSIVNHLTVGEAGDTYYIALSKEKLDEGMRMAAVNTSFDSYIDDPSITEVANVVVSNDCTYATVTFHTVVSGNYHFEARMIDTLGMDRGRWGRSVRVESDAPGLYFCYADRDDSTESWFINYDQIDEAWYSVPGHNKVGSFFFGKKSDIAAGKVDPIPLNDLEFRGDLDADDLEDDYKPTENLLIVDATGFGGKYIRYTENGVHYDMPVHIELPEFGFYTEDAPEEEAFIYRQNPMTITETDRTFYLLSRDTDEFRFCSIRGWDDLAQDGDIFDISVNSDGSGVKLTVKDDVIVPNDQIWVEFEYEVYRHDNWERRRNDVAVCLENGQPALMVRHLEWDDEEQEWFESKKRPLETNLYCTTGDSFVVRFYYGTEDDHEAVDLDELTFPMGILSAEMEDDAQRLEAIGYEERGVITYENEDGEIVSMQVYVEAPRFGLYSSKTASKQTYLGEDVILGGGHSAYIVAADPDDQYITAIEYVWNNRTGADATHQFTFDIAADGSYAIVGLNPNDLPEGTGHYEIRIRNQYGGHWHVWFQLERGDLEQLATPTNLVWHKEYHQWTNSAGQVQLNTETRMGDMSFEVHGLCQNRFEVELYSAADGYTTPIGEYSWGFGDKKDRTHFSVCDFIYADLPSGTYKFRVRTRGDGTEYRSSEWSALSPAFTYTQPAQRLTAPAADDLAWERIDGRFAATWPLSAGTQTGAECFEIQWYYRDENGKIRESGSSFDMYVSDNFRNGRYFDHISDWLLEEHGNTEYFFTIRVIPGDITKYRPSKHSDRSPAFTMDYITDAVNDKLDGLLKGSATVPTVQDVQDALFGDTGDLRMAMAADQSIAGGTSGGTLDRIRQLEQTAADNVVQQVKAKTNAPQQLKDITNGITMIGATLNLADKNPSSGTTPTVTLEIDEPQQGIVIDEQQHNAVQFSMKLSGAVDKDDQNQAGQQLIVPVAIDMPVPSGINPDFLVVLHRLWDGSVEEMRPYIYWHETDLCWHARFVVDSFSDFALVEDRSLTDGEEDEEEPEAIELRKIVLRDPETGDKLNAIPEGPADVTVKIMGLEEDTNCVIILTAYAENGQMVDLKVLKERSFTEDGMAWYDTSIDNADGRIASLKAMAVPKMISATPLCAAVEFAPDAPSALPFFVETSADGDTATLIVKGNMNDDDYVEVIRADDGYILGSVLYEGLNENGYHVYTYENPYMVEQDFAFRLMVDGEKVDFVTLHLSPMVPETPMIQNFEVVGSKAILHVYGPLTESDRIMCYSYNVFKYDYLGEAVLESSDGNNHVFTFENTTGLDRNIQFRLMAGPTGAQVSSIEFYVPAAAPEVKTGLLPTNIHLEYDPDSGLRMVMDSVPNPDYVEGGIISYAYDINNGESSFTRNIHVRSVGTALLTNYDVLKEGDNTVTITLTANPTAEAAAQGYGMESTTFTASVYYAEEPGTYDTDAVDVSIEDIEDAAGKAMKKLQVSGLKPNQSYVITAWTEDGISNKRELTTDESGAAIDEWYSDYDFTYCTIAEWWVTNVSDTNANIIYRKYDHEFRFGGEEPEQSPMEIHVEGNRATIVVSHPMTSVSDYIAVHALMNGEYEEVGSAEWEVIGDGIYVFSFENTLGAEYEFLFQLWVDDECVAFEKAVISAAAPANEMTISAEGNKAMITVTGDLTTGHCVEVYTADMEYLCDADYVMLGDGYTIFCFENTTGIEQEFAFALGVNDTVLDVQTLVLPAAALRLLPDDMRLTSENSDALKISWTPVSDADMLVSKVRTAYDVNNGSYTTSSNSSFSLLFTSGTSLLPTFEPLQPGENTVAVTFTAEPSAYAADQGYAAEQYTFTANIHVTETTADYDTSKITVDKDNMIVCGLKPNQSYQAKLYTAANDLYTVEFTTDASGCGNIDRWYGVSFTHMTLAEWEVSDVSANSADIIVRKYAGTIYFEDEAAGADVWFSDSYGNVYLNWTPVQLSSGEYYFVNGKNTYNSSGQYFFGSMLSEFTETTDIVIGRGTFSAGQTEVLYTLKDGIVVEDLGSVPLRLTPITAGSNQGKYQMAPVNAAMDTTGMTYYLQMTNADGGFVIKETNNTTGIFAAAPFEGCVAEGRLAKIALSKTIVENDTSKALQLQMGRSSTVTAGMTLAAESNLVTEVSTLNALESALRMGGTVRLTADISGSVLSADSGAAAVLDLNGHSLTLNNFLYVKNGKDLTIIGGEDKDGVLTASNSQLQYGSSLQMRGLTFNGHLSASSGNNGYARSRQFKLENVNWTYDSANANYSALLLDGTIHVELIDCTVTSASYSALQVRNSDRVVVDGGSYTCQDTRTNSSASISLDECDFVSITDVTGTSVQSGLRISRSGDIELEDCDLSINNNSTSYWVIYATDFDTLSIDGGNYTADCLYGHVVYVVNSTGATVSIADGTFINISKPANVFNISSAEAIITGGTFSADPSKYVDTEIYTVTEADGLWTVEGGEEPPTMEITAADARADIAVYAEDMSKVDRIEVHALLNGEYEYVADAAWEVVGDGVIYFSFENPYTFGCEFLFQLWSGDEVAQWQTLLLPGCIDSSEFIMEVVTDGSTATITITGNYPEDAYVEAVADVDGAWGVVGQAGMVNSFGDLHTYTFTHTEPIGRNFVFRLMADGTDLLSSEIVWLEGMMTGEW